MFERYQPDLDAYVRRARSGPCFVCAVVSRDPDFPEHHVIGEDDAAIAFLNKYPTQYGSALVAPKEHKEQVAGDFTIEEYLGLQQLVYRVAEAVREEVGAERVYLLSLGSNEGNAHVHWQVVPLPPGTPYEEQQFAALMFEAAGVLEIPEEEMISLAHRIWRRMGLGG
ncbi:MAG TPA: HIT family protein [Rubrobacter sp.]|nr:HIT family protein [Rubrobacter sp.]